jgi:MoaA/NifB/PqqE/SkfB family radical SAM enzyme
LIDPEDSLYGQPSLSIFAGKIRTKISFQNWKTLVSHPVIPDGNRLIIRNVIKNNEGRSFHWPVGTIIVPYFLEKALEKYEEEMKFLENIGMMVTYKCQVACPHCIVEAGPHRCEEIDPCEAIGWLRDVVTYDSGKIKGVSLTGGEPFYDITTLRTITDLGNAAGLFMTAVTNAYWATTLSEAVDVLRSLPSLKMLGISTDVYHQEFISFDRVANAIQAAEMVQIPIQISVCTESKSDSGYQEIMRKLLKIVPMDTIDTVITFSVGRASAMMTPEYRRDIHPPISACTAAGSPIIFPDGRVIACIGPLINLTSDHHLLLGNLREDTLQNILNRAQMNPVLHAIRIWGPHRLLDLLGKMSGTILLDQFIENNVCDICYRLFSNGEFRSLIESLAEDREFIQMIAYARSFYLRENDMLELINSAKTMAG